MDVMAASDYHLIKEDDHVLFKKENNLRMFQVHQKRDIWLEKAKFSIDGIIGHPYGTTFEVKNHGMVKVDKSSKQDTEKADKGMEAEKDNRNLHDSDSNQKLTADEIEQLKKDGVTGSELIEHLIENSTTFQNKTEYAQQKWVKKKKKKHLLEFTILKPNSRLLCEMYWSKGPSRILNLRIDSLAQILCLGNVKAGSTVGVVDNCLGLVVGGVLERLGGYGQVVSFYHGDSPQRTPLEAYDFPKEVMDTLFHFPMESINSLKYPKPLETESVESATNEITPALKEVTDSIKEETKNSSSNDEELDKPVEQTGMDIDACKDDSAKSNEQTGSQTNLENKSDSVTHSNKNEKVTDQAGKWQKKGRWSKRGGKNRNKKRTLEERVAVKEARSKQIDEARNILVDKKLDCLIIACKFHPTPVAMALLDYVLPSRQLIVYSQFKTALEDCYSHLREQKGLVNYQLTETWLREYQVLPNRTHPVIQMSGTGGYLMSATTVIKPTTCLSVTSRHKPTTCTS